MLKGIVEKITPDISANFRKRKKTDALFFLFLLLQCSDSSSFRIVSKKDRGWKSRNIKKKLRASAPSLDSGKRRSFTTERNSFQKLNKQQMNSNIKRKKESKGSTSRQGYSTSSRRLGTARCSLSAVSPSHIVGRKHGGITKDITWTKALVDLNRKLAAFLISAPTKNHILKRGKREQRILSTSSYDAAIKASGISLLLIFTLSYAIIFLEGEPLACFSWAAWTSYICTMVSRVGLKEF